MSRTITEEVQRHLDGRKILDRSQELLETKEPGYTELITLSTWIMRITVTDSGFEIRAVMPIAEAKNA